LSVFDDLFRECALIDDIARRCQKYSQVQLAGYLLQETLLCSQNDNTWVRGDTIVDLTRIVSAGIRQMSAPICAPSSSIVQESIEKCEIVHT
jgi:hypothetical protein